MNHDIEKLVNGYTYKVFWSDEDQEYIGVCEEFPSLSFLDSDKFKAFEGVIELVKSVMYDMAKNDELKNFLQKY